MGSNSSAGSKAVEAPNTLLSTSRIKILDLLGEGTIDGFWPQTGVSGYNPLVSTYFDGTPVMNGDGSVNYNVSGAGFKFDYTFGTSGQEIINGFDQVHTLVPLPNNTRISNPPAEGGDRKDVVVTINTANYPDAEGFNLTVRVPTLSSTDDKGNTNAWFIHYQVEVSTNGGPYGIVRLEKVEGKCTSPYLRTTHYFLPKPDPNATFYEWKIRISRFTTNILSVRVSNEIFVESVAVISSNGYRYPMTALVGLQMDALQFAGIPVRAYDVRGIKVAVPSGYTPTRFSETLIETRCDIEDDNQLIGLTTQTSTELDKVLVGMNVYGEGFQDNTKVVSKDYSGGSGPFFFEVDKKPVAKLETKIIRAYGTLKDNPFIGMDDQSSGAELDQYIVGMTVSGPGIPDGTKILSKDYGVGGLGPYFFVMDQKAFLDQFTPVTMTFLILESTTYLNIPTKGRIYTGGSVTQSIYPSIWNGVFSSEKVWTNNPAWIFYDLITNKRYGLGNYFKKDWLDKWTLYQIAQYCDELVDDGDGGLEPRFTCNTVVNSEKDAYTLLNEFVSVFRGILYWANGRLFPVGPETRQPVYNFTNANVVEGNFGYSNTPKNTRSTVVSVRWQDPKNLFRQTTELLEDPDGIGKYGYIEKAITAFATTSRGQALRLANWLLTVEQTLTETVTFQTSNEGIYLHPGDIFNVYDNYRNSKQQGGRVVEFNAARTVLTLDRDIVIEPAFTYTLSTVIPNRVALGTGDLTGSNQIPLIRNSQIETKTVITSPGTGNSLTVSSAFSSGLFPGSTWIISASGSAASIFDSATQYRCLATSEVDKSTIEILGLQYQTGISRFVENNYLSQTTPIVIGDQNPPGAPNGLIISPVSGLLLNNEFFYYLNLRWGPSPSSNASYYSVSGSGPGIAAGLIKQTPATNLNYVPSTTGFYNFDVGAHNANGIPSTRITGGFFVPTGHPLSNRVALSGVVLVENYDDSYTNIAHEPTGYFGLQPGFSWEVLKDLNERDAAAVQFVNGYKLNIKSLDDTIDYVTPITISDVNTKTYKFPEGLINGFVGGPQRGFDFRVSTTDVYGNTTLGGSVKVINPPPRTPVFSGFVGFNGGFSYTISPNTKDTDISGVYFWHNTGSAFTPTFNNPSFHSDNLAGFTLTPYNNPYYAWFSVVDTFGASGCSIYGPVSINPYGNVNLSGVQRQIDEAVSGAYNSLSGIDATISGAISGALSSTSGFTTIINNAVSGAIAGLTGTITDSINIISGEGYLNAQAINGISGQILGTTNGSLNTALTVRTDAVVVSSSGALATQINAVSARLVQSGVDLNATVGNVSTALTASGIALGLSISTVQSNVNTLSGYTNAQVLTAQNTIASTGSALATQVNAVQANVVSLSGYTSANFVSQQTSIATTGSALTTSLNAVTAALATTGSLLNSRVVTLDTALTASGISLGQRITDVQASVTTLSGYTNAQITNVQTALATSGSSLASQVNLVQANVVSLSGTTNANIISLQTATATTGQALTTSVNNLAANLALSGSNLNSRVSTLDTALAASGTALASSIQTVQSNLNTVDSNTNARVDTANATIVTSSGALSTQINSVSSSLNGVSANVTILTDAYVVDGVAIATWGFNLNGAGKVVSMKAIAANNTTFGGTLGTIKFGGANLESDSFSAGSAGWQLKYNGDTEFNSLIARGTVSSSTYTAGSAGWQINQDGNAEFNSITARGSISSTNGTYFARILNGQLGMGSSYTRSTITSYSNVTVLNFGGGAILQEANGYGNLILRSYSYGPNNVSLAGNGDGTFAGTLSCAGLTCTTIDTQNNNITMGNGELVALKIRASDGGSTSAQGYGFGGNYDNRMFEYYGINLQSQGSTWPVRIRDGALLMGGFGYGSNYNAGYIYFSSSVYLYESGGYLYLNDGNGDRALT